MLTLFNPTYPKSHFDILSLFLLGSQVALFLLFLFLHRLHPHSHFQSFSKGFFVVYFAFWRTAYDLGLGWVLTKQSKRKWIVRLVRGRGWLDTDRRPAVREWIRRQLEGKMGRDYKFDVRRRFDYLFGHKGADKILFLFFFVPLFFFFFFFF